jgi:hypothetical protein
MENNAYNRMIAGEVDNIIRNFISYQQKTGKEMKEDSLVPLVKANTSYGKGQMQGGSIFGDILDTVKAVGSVAPLAVMALKGRGKPKKGGKKRGGNVFGDILDTVKTVGSLAPLAMMALGEPKRGGEIKTVPMRALTPANIRAPAKPVRSGNGSYARAIGSGAMDSEMFEKKAGSIFGSMIPFGNLIGLAEPGEDGKVAGKRRPGRPRKAGSIGVDLMAETKNNLLTQKRRAKKGGNIFDDIVSGVGSVVKATAETLPSALAIGKMLAKGEPESEQERIGEGFLDDLFSGVKSTIRSVPGALKQTVDVARDVKEIGKILKGGKKSAKSSKWIEHCKAFAKKHKMSFKDAMKDPRCKNSYKK